MTNRMQEKDYNDKKEIKGKEYTEFEMRQSAYKKDVQLDKKYVVIDKPCSGFCTLQRVFDYTMFDNEFRKQHFTEYISGTVEEIKMYMNVFGLRVLNAKITKDNKLIIKKTHFHPTIIGYMYELFFTGWQIDDENTLKRVRATLEWLCKPYGGLSCNLKNILEIVVFDRYFPDCMNKKEYVEMLEMSKRNPDMFMQYVIEDLQKIYAKIPVKC